MVDQQLATTTEEIQPITVAVPPPAIVDEVLSNAEYLAKQLKKRIDGNPDLYTRIGEKQYIRAEGWQTISEQFGVSWIAEYVSEIWRDNKLVGWQAKVNLVRRGEIVGSGIMPCGLDDFPCRGKTGMSQERSGISSAQTWAGAKAARMKFAWVAVLAGFSPVPAEEMGESLPEAPTRPGQPTGRDPWVVCPKHGKTWMHTEKQQLAGHAPSHKEGELWCDIDTIVTERSEEVADSLGLDSRGLAERLSAAPNYRAKFLMLEAVQSTDEAVEVAPTPEVNPETGEITGVAFASVKELYQAAGDRWIISRPQIWRNLGVKSDAEVRAMGAAEAWARLVEIHDGAGEEEIPEPAE
jgi:hypothetical protein